MLRTTLPRLKVLEHLITIRCTHCSPLSYDPDCVVEEVQEQLPQYDVEKHLAQYDKEEFMQLVFSVLRDMEAVHAAGQLDNMVLYSQEQQQPQQQSDAPPQQLDQVERADGTRTDAKA